METIYELNMDYDVPVHDRGTLSYFINLWGEEAVETLLKNPGSIHWTASLKPVVANELTNPAEYIHMT